MNLDKVTFSQLDSERYQGSDASLRISLGEYGFAWKVCQKSQGNFKKGDFRFIYAVDWAGENAVAFCHTELSKDTDWKKEWNWSKSEDLQKFLDYVGLDEEAFNKLPLPEKVESLVNYFGYLNIFGENNAVFFIKGLYN